MPSSPSSEFDFELDEDDLRELDLVEQAALSQQQPTPSTSTSTISIPTITQSPKTPIRSPQTFFRPTITTPTVSPVRTFPSQKSPTTVRSQTIPPSTGVGLAVKGRARPLEPPTHHPIDHIAAKTWIYPTNKTFRDYQFNIVQRALFDNVLVSLPTGLGKTFIAAVVMYNYYRWFPKSKIVFVAPTRPLVAQQVDACFHICGVPYSETAELTGTNQLAVRELAYAERRVFYMTPQTLANDLKRGAIDAKDIVCLVIDEAHRATGKYAYGECVTLIRKDNPSFRVLALSATPGSSIEAVQNVIDSCSIARVEIRIETSLDLAPFLHKRKNEVIVVPLGDEITELRELLVKVLSKFLDKVKALNDYRLRDPYNITQFQVNEARKAMFSSGRGSNQVPYANIANLSIIGALGQAMGLLVYHGIQPFYEKLSDVQSEHEKKGAQTSKALTKDENFQELMTRSKILTDNPNTVGHPKIERAASMIINHFLTKADEGVDTRVMVFVQYRSSASVLVKQLKRQEPLIKPQLFVGQATDSRGGNGMKQKEQKEVPPPKYLPLLLFMY
jgi:ATP-dependent DNA helicase MPH1